MNPQVLKTLRQIHTNFFLFDLRMVKPYIAGRAARARPVVYGFTMRRSIEIPLRGGFGVVLRVLARSVKQTAVMHGKNIARSHSVLMHACMFEDLVQLSINRPTDIGAGCALLAARQQPLACCLV